MNNKTTKTGYSNPPRNSQFKPGVSGNPKGRPKGSKNLSTDVAEELAQQVSLNEGGTPIVISKQRAIIKTLVARSLKGDARACTALIKLIQTSEIAKPDKSSIEPLSKDDQAILDDYINDVINSNIGETNNE